MAKKNNKMRVKILKGDPFLIGKILEIIQSEEMIYRCEKTGLVIIDTWNELESIKTHTPNFFHDLHLFVEENNKLMFIDEIKILR